MPAGELSVKLGEVYYGFGDYQKAADAINQGLQKGQIKHLDEAYVYLGLADVQLKNYADAKKAFRESQERAQHQPARVEAVGRCTRQRFGRLSAANSEENAMTIKAGDKMPDGKFTRMTKDGPQKITTDELFKGKTVVLFSVPGAFTPTCDAKHLPGFVELADQIKAKGVDTIACTAVNDVFVMNAWGKAGGVGDKILMLADGNGEYAKALGLELNATGFGMGIRGQRFAIIVKNGVATHVERRSAGRVQGFGRGLRPEAALARAKLCSPCGPRRRYSRLAQAERIARDTYGLAGDRCARCPASATATFTCAPPDGRGVRAQDPRSRCEARGDRLPGARAASIWPSRIPSLPVPRVFPDARSARRPATSSAATAANTPPA